MPASLPGNGHRNTVLFNEVRDNEMKKNNTRTLIITGASRGIGAALAKSLAGAGTNLVLCYHRDKKAANRVEARCRDRGSRVILVRGDICEPDCAQQIVDRSVEAFDTIHGLVNNAAVVREELLALLEDEDLEAMLATNIAGMVRLTRAVLRPMMRQKRGSVINISSVAATRPNRGNAVYAGTKGFVESFTRALAVELGPKQIRVNAVAPGVIETKMSRAVRTLAGDAITDSIALRRFGTVDEIAKVVSFLLSDDAAYITGAVVPVDGGY